MRREFEVSPSHAEALLPMLMAIPEEGLQGQLDEAERASESEFESSHASSRRRRRSRSANKSGRRGSPEAHRR